MAYKLFCGKKLVKQHKNWSKRQRFK